MDASDIKRTIFSVSDFLAWQRAGTLDLRPAFQRRSVWKPGARSYLIDTVVRSLPTPLIFLRERIDTESFAHIRDVIDGQQRLRTLFTYVDPHVLGDEYDEARDFFTVRREHNAEIAGKTYKQLDADLRRQILSYEFSTHVLPSSTEDREVLMLFARLNSTGTALNQQELRNARYFGTFKTLMYQLSYEQLDRWLDWRVFDEDAISRMQEVELVSDLAINMIAGLTGKSQPGLSRAYKKYDEAIPHEDELARRFRRVMDEIQTVLGEQIQQSVFRRPVYFFTLFTFLYDEMWGLGVDMPGRKQPRELPQNLSTALVRASTAFRTEDVPDRVLDAVQRASADLGRRRTRLEYLRAVARGETA